MQVITLHHNIKEMFPGVRTNCWQYFVFLHSIYPEAMPWYDYNHVMGKIGNAFYDIDGQHFMDSNGRISYHDPAIGPITEYFYPMEHRLIKGAHRWTI